MSDDTNPRPYNVKVPSEMRRLLREVRGYLRACEKQHHGTDFQGRQFAIDALDELTTDEWLVRAHARIGEATG